MRKGRTPLKRGRGLPAAKYVVVMERDRISGRHGPPRSPPAPHSASGSPCPGLLMVIFVDSVLFLLTILRSWEVKFRKMSLSLSLAFT